jgi:heme oxygenase (biliverdin-IX-beta and delta-forming)
MIMARLKQETKVYHEQLETNPYSRAMSDGTLTREAYSEMLQRFYGFYRPLEAQLQQFSPVDVSERQHTPFLVRDLQTLDCLVEALPLCDDLPQITTPARALGSLYVLEGATLGGQIITRQLKRFGLTPENGVSFFNSYGERVGEMWKAFIVSANTYAETHGHEDEMVDAASETFITFGRWLNRVPATTS